MDRLHGLPGERTIDDTATAADATDPGAAGNDASGADAIESPGEQSIGRRAARTRGAILAASRTLFLERGYAGTRINNITDACGISRAGFYTYFKDKREIFDVLGETAYREVLAVVGEWDALPRPCTVDDVAGWVRRYFAFMDQHGAFVLAAQQGPPDEEVRASSTRMQMRVAWLLGVHLHNRQRTPGDAPEAIGLSTQAMLDRSWYHARVQRLPVADDDLVAALATTIVCLLEA
jgi:AcrR family transcriptional regulator